MDEPSPPLEKSRLLAPSKECESKLKESENILRFSEERYRALFRDNPTMIVTLNSDLMMLSVNPACASQLDYTINELEGQSVLNLFHKEDRLGLTEQLRICLQNPNQVHRWQFRKIRKSGEVLWVEEIAQAVYDPNGGLNLLVVCQDISERRRTEEALRASEEKISKLNVTLEARAAELEDANRELEAFNYTVAHDLRQPLNSIGLNCQAIDLLCGDDLSQECKGYVQGSYEGVLRMNRMIEALLNFSIMAHTPLNRGRADLSRMAKAVAAELQGTAAARRVTFQIADGFGRCQGSCRISYAAIF